MEADRVAEVAERYGVSRSMARKMIVMRETPAIDNQLKTEQTSHHPRCSCAVCATGRQEQPR